VIASRADFVLVTRQTVEAMGGIEAILDQPALRSTPAGRNGKVLQFDTLLLLGFGPRTPQAATELAAALHPEIARAP
jgi:iron complex transport system substrate-binding protein